MKKDKLSQLTQVNTKKNFIQNFDNDQGYIRIKEAAKRETKLIMQDFRMITGVTLSATVEAITRYLRNYIDPK